MRPSSRLLVLSVIAGSLATLTSLAGILQTGTYARETAAWAVQAMGQDCANLPAAVVLVWSAALVRRGSVFTLITLPLGIVHARRHRVVAHRNAMLWLFLGALLTAGVFTLMPGRVMHKVVFE